MLLSGRLCALGVAEAQYAEFRVWHVRCCGFFAAVDDQSWLKRSPESAER